MNFKRSEMPRKQIFYYNTNASKHNIIQFQPKFIYIDVYC